MKTSGFQEINGERVYHFVMKMASSSFVDIFYRFRSRIDAYTDLNVERTMLYRKNEKARKRKRDIEVHFDWDEMILRYFRSGKEQRSLPLKPSTLDPLSAFYYLRISDLGTRRVLEFPVSDGKKIFMGRATVKGRETLRLESGTFETFMLEPETDSFGGVFKQSAENSLHVWISSDDRRLPVKIKSRVFIGSIIIELAEIKNLL